MERLKVSSIGSMFENPRYVNNTENAEFDYLLFNGNQKLYQRRIYHVNDNIVERLNNGFIAYVHTNKI